MLNKRTCLDCDDSISHLHHNASRCPSCVQIRERSLAKERIKSGNGRNFNYDFKHVVHGAQRDTCIICGWTIPGRAYGACVAHHIAPVCEGGKSVAENGAILCPNCHAEAHIGLIAKETLLLKAQEAVKSGPRIDDLMKIINNIRSQNAIKPKKTIKNKSTAKGFVAAVNIFKALGYYKLSEKELCRLLLSLKEKTDRQKSTNCNDRKGYFMYDFLLAIKNRTIDT